MPTSDPASLPPLRCRTVSPTRLLAAVAVLVLAAPVAAPQALVEPGLARALADAAPDAHVEVLVALADAPDAEALAARYAARPARPRRAAIADELATRTAAARAPLDPWLDAATARGEVRAVRALWIAHALVLDATPAAVDALAAHPSVARLHLVARPPLERVRDAAPPAPPSSGFPFFDDFESGVLGPGWSVATTGTGAATVTSDFDPRGDFHVTLGCDNTPSLVRLDLQLDLAGQPDVGLRFRFKEFGDEPDPEDAVLVSDDGVTFVELLSLQDGSQQYEARFVDLDEAVANLGLALTSAFTIRFQWTDDTEIPFDGFAFDEVEVAPGVGVPPPADVPQNIAALQAPLLWDLGFDGAGVLVGSIDGGVALDHPDLVGALWSNPGEIPGNGLDDDANGYVDDVVGWDFIDDDNDPVTGPSDDHGTNSAGLIVGDGSGGVATGMAPGATLVVTEVASEAEFMLAQQYLLEAGVDVITSSYSFKWPDRPDYATFRAITDVERAAGIVHVNSIGNQGLQSNSTHPIPFNISAPGNTPSPFAHPDLAPGGRSAVLACGGILLPNDAPYALSGRGPSAWEDFLLYDPAYPNLVLPNYFDYPFGGFGPGPGLIKPDVVTYTGGVTTTGIPGILGLYDTYSGTSAAAPQLAGGVALLRHVQPLAEPRHVAAAIELSAVDLGDPGKDDRYGSGKLAVFDAARSLLVLAKVTPQVVPVGQSFDLDVVGEPGALAFGYVSAAIADAPSGFHLVPPFVTLPALPFDGNGELSLSLPVPAIPGLAGLTVWFQYGQASGAFKTDWGGGPVISVPEPVMLLP